MATPGLMKEVDEVVERVLSKNAEYEVRIEIVYTANLGRIATQSKKCASFVEAMEVYKDACKQLGEGP